MECRNVKPETTAMTLGYNMLKENVMVARTYEGVMIHFMGVRKQRGHGLGIFLCILMNNIFCVMVSIFLQKLFDDS